MREVQIGTRFKAYLMLALVLAGLVLIALFTRLAIYVSVVAIGLAFALQKYVGSYFGYFVIASSRIFVPGDRIRIGNIKGDVKKLGLLHFVLEEVGEDEKMGGELTGRVLYIPNLIVLDQPVLNYSKSYTRAGRSIQCEYIFDEVRIPLTPRSDISKAAKLLEEILTRTDAEHLAGAREAFGQDYPNFVHEAEVGPRILVSIEPKQVWLKGKFVTPFRSRNDLRTKICQEFLQVIKTEADISVA